VGGRPVQGCLVCPEAWLFVGRGRRDGQKGDGVVTGKSGSVPAGLQTGDLDRYARSGKGATYKKVSNRGRGWKKGRVGREESLEEPLQGVKTEGRGFHEKTGSVDPGEEKNHPTEGGGR